MKPDTVCQARIGCGDRLAREWLRIADAYDAQPGEPAKLRAETKPKRNTGPSDLALSAIEARQDENADRTQNHHIEPGEMVEERCHHTILPDRETTPEG